MSSKNGRKPAEFRLGFSRKKKPRGNRLTGKTTAGRVARVAGLGAAGLGAGLGARALMKKRGGGGGLGAVSKALPAAPAALPAARSAAPAALPAARSAAPAAATPAAPIKTRRDINRERLAARRQSLGASSDRSANRQNRQSTIDAAGGKRNQPLTKRQRNTAKVQARRSALEGESRRLKKASKESTQSKAWSKNRRKNKRDIAQQQGTSVREVNAKTANANRVAYENRKKSKKALQRKVEQLRQAGGLYRHGITLAMFTRSAHRRGIA